MLLCIIFALVRLDAKSRRNYKGSVIQAKFRQGSGKMRSTPFSIWIKRVRYTKQTVVLRPLGNENLQCMSLSTVLLRQIGRRKEIKPCVKPNHGILGCVWFIILKSRATLLVSIYLLVDTCLRHAVWVQYSPLIRAIKYDQH